MILFLWWSPTAWPYRYVCHFSLPSKPGSFLLLFRSCSSLLCLSLGSRKSVKLQVEEKSWHALLRWQKARCAVLPIGRWEGSVAEHSCRRLCPWLCSAWVKVACCSVRLLQQQFQTISSNNPEGRRSPAFHLGNNKQRSGVIFFCDTCGRTRYMQHCLQETSSS